MKPEVLKTQPSVAERIGSFILSPKGAAVLVLTAALACATPTFVESVNNTLTPDYSHITEQILHPRGDR